MESNFRRMGDPGHRDVVRALVHEPHVADLNSYVDILRARRPEHCVPYVSPEFGGVRARLLLLTLSPGVQTREDGARGSGMLSADNADVAAERIAAALEFAGIDRRECVPWNVYPWDVGSFAGRPAVEREVMLREGADLLIQVIARLPRLRSVFIFGGLPRTAWTYFARDYPKTDRMLRKFHHRSTGPRGYIGSREQQTEWTRQLFEEMTAAVDSLTCP